MSRNAGGREPEAASLLVVAHPDDETLWLEPLLSAESAVVVAFPNHPRKPTMTAAREDLRARFPYGAMEFLPLESIDVLGRSDWRQRVPTEYGVDLRADCPDEIRAAYIDNHRRLCDLLAPYLAVHHVVYTHNPWGEYGHEEHIQVCRAVLDTGATHHTCVWAWDGLSPAELMRTKMRLRRDYYDDLAGLPRIVRSLDRARYRQLKDFYTAAGAWTWDDDYEPPAAMNYVEIMHEGRELLPRSTPRWGARAAGILGGNVRYSPRVVKRLFRGDGLRAR